MKPYYEKNGIVIYHGDFRDHLALFREADLVMADPPYGETSLEWDKWPKGWPGLVAGVVKPNASLWCFGSARMFWEKRDEFDAWRFVQDVVWEKQNGSGFAADRFKRVHELAYHFTLSGTPWGDVFKAPQKDGQLPAVGGSIKKRGPRAAHMGQIGEGTYDRFTPRMKRSVIYAKNCHGTAVNETQKPEGLVVWPVRYSCPVGGLVLSPFMGSGTDLVVARACGMKAIGFDKREGQCEAAAQRLSQEVLDLEVA